MIDRSSSNTPCQISIRPSGKSMTLASRTSPTVSIPGEVVEANAPHKLVQTWRMLMEPQLAAEGFTRLSMDIEAVRGGVTKLTITHDLTNAPIQTALYSGEWESKGASWHEVLSGLKTLLETGAQLPFQSGPGKDCT
jgi:uncharacterized protein YndB with AHSA1/START domain